MGGRRLLTINTGSSSLKAALYRLWEGAETLELRAEASRIGDRGGGLRLADARGETLDERQDNLPDHAAALNALLSRLRDQGLDRDEGIGLKRGADVRGALLIVSALMLGVYTILGIVDHGWSSTHTLGLGAVALALLVAFIVRETRTPNPLVPLRIFRSLNVSGANLV